MSKAQVLDQINKRKQQDTKLLAICNRKWRNQPQFHNLTPRAGTLKFMPATKILDTKKYGSYWIVLLDASIRGYPKFKVTTEELEKERLVIKEKKCHF